MGHPTHAVALVLGVLLSASGLGSLWSVRLIGRSGAKMTALLCILAALVAVEALFGPRTKV